MVKDEIKSLNESWYRGQTTLKHLRDLNQAIKRIQQKQALLGEIDEVAWVVEDILNGLARNQVPKNHPGMLKGMGQKLFEELGRVFLGVADLTGHPSFEKLAQKFRDLATQNPRALDGPPIDKLAGDAYSSIGTGKRLATQLAKRYGMPGELEADKMPGGARSRQIARDRNPNR